MTVPANRVFLIIFCAIPVVFFFRTVLAMSVNVPFQDDFDGLLEPVLLLSGQEKMSFSEFWKILYTQDDERRIVVDRLAAYSIFKLTGELNLRVMMIAGAFNLLLLLWIFFQWFKSTKTAWLLFLPIPWILFNIQFYEAIFWAMIPFQHVAVFVWAILTIWLLSRNSGRTFAGAIVSALFTIFADVSGNFVLLAGLLVLLTQFRWKAAVIWTMIVGVVVWFYFSGLVIPDYRPKFSDNFSNPVQLISLLIALFGIWSDPGPAFPFLLRETLAIVFGIAGICFTAYLLIGVILKVIQKREALRNNQAFLWGSICFIAIVLVVLASGRAAEGLESVFKPRYRHMYALWLIFMYLLALRYRPYWFSGKIVTAGVLIAGVFFGINTYAAYWGPLDNFRKILLSDAYQWYHNRALPSSPIYLSLRKRVDDIYESAYNRGIYRPESYPFSDLPEAPVKGSTEIELVTTGESVEVILPDFKRKAGKNDGAYVIFRSATGEAHILPAYHSSRPLHRVLLEGSYYYPGAQTDRYASTYFQSDVFEVEVGVIEGKNQYRLVTGKQLRL